MLVLFVIPFYRLTVDHFVEALAGLEGVSVGVISQDPWESFPAHLHTHLAGHWQVADALNVDALEWASRKLSQRLGRIHRILAINEHVQIPVAQLRERLDILGMDSATIRRFRDKALMKDLFEEHGVPCARHVAAMDIRGAWRFVEESGFPICVKPVDGAAAQATFRVDDAEQLSELLAHNPPQASRPLQLEEFVVGEESSFETVSLDGEPKWHSLTHYHPTPLTVLTNPWIQWRMLLPREIDAQCYNDVRDVGCRALKALGMTTGITHMEWFRRDDGSLAIGEVAARPPGEQIVMMMNRGHDISLYRIWAQLMVQDRVEVPTERRFAVGTLFLRGLGGGQVKAVHGLQEVAERYGELITDVQIPEPGQAAGLGYEGDGYLMLRHPQTGRVEAALDFLASQVRVEMVQ